MKPVFDENGLATEPGETRCFYYDAVTYEYMGWSDEYINLGVSMPGHSTDIDPGENIPEKVAVFTGKGWSHEEDHRNETVYSIENGAAVTVDYIGAIKNGYVTLSPSTPYDKWDGEKWVTDAAALKAGQINDAEQERRYLLAEADQITADWRTELALGIIDDGDKAKLTAWMKYIKAVKAVDTSTAPDINWPARPED